jgi:hypothetical protein
LASARDDDAVEWSLESFADPDPDPEPEPEPDPEPDPDDDDDDDALNIFSHGRLIK